MRVKNLNVFNTLLFEFDGSIEAYWAGANDNNGQGAPVIY